MSGMARTRATIADPETTEDSSQPMVDTTGLRATRTGYFHKSRRGGTPRARAAVT